MLGFKLTWSLNFAKPKPFHFTHIGTLTRPFPRVKIASLAYGIQWYFRMKSIPSNMPVVSLFITWIINENSSFPKRNVRLVVPITVILAAPAVRYTLVSLDKNGVTSKQCNLTKQLSIKLLSVRVSTVHFPGKVLIMIVLTTLLLSAIKKKAWAGGSSFDQINMIADNNNVILLSLLSAIILIWSKDDPPAQFFFSDRQEGRPVSASLCISKHSDLGCHSCSR